MSSDLMPLLFGFCVRASLVLALAWVVTMAMRRASASARHFLWTCAIAAAALVPVTALAVPNWRVPVPAALTVLASRIAPAAIETPAAQATTPQAEAASTPASDLSAIARNATADARATTSASPSVGGIGALSAAGIVLTVWAIGSAVLLLYLLIGFAGAWWMRRRAVRADARLFEETDTLAEALEVPRPIPVVESATLTMPMVCGLWRPLIVMPIEAAQWPEERRRVVILHELAHIKRRDCLTQALAYLVCAAYWFNPIVWIAARRLRAEREHACDDFVLAAGTRGSEYAAHLLDIAQAMQPRLFSPVAATGLAMARRTQLEGRLMAILDPAIRRSSALYTRFAAAALVALVAVPVAAVELVSPVSTGDVADITLSTATRPVAPTTAAPVRTAQAPARASVQAPVKPTTDDRLRRTLNRTLIEFADEGDVEGVEALIAAGADVNAAIEGDGSPLINAADEGQLEIVRLLLDKGADPDLIVPGDGSALIAAASEGHLDIVRLLLDRTANPNLIVSGDGSALIAAAGEGHIDVVELLLARGAQVNLVVEGEETALIQASGEGDLAMVKLLVSRGADVNLGVSVEETVWFRDGRFGDVRARNGSLSRTELRTPLSEAREDRHLAVVTFLISAGARD